MSQLDEYFQRLLHGPPFKDKEEMKYEALRLASFDSWPLWADKRPGCLAENGFYYSGHGDSVKCYACHGEIAEWSFNDDVAEKHRSLFPDCPFVQQRSYGNKTMEGILLGGVEIKTKDHSSKLCEAEELLKQMASISAAKPSDIRNIQQPGPGSHLPEKQQSSLTAAFDPEQMKDEDKRLETYNGRWPHGLSVLSEKLAKAGFYYCGPGDRVMCAFCKGSLEEWKPTDDPINEHKKYFSTCSFINKISSSDTPDRVENLNKDKQPKKKPTPDQFGVVCEKPKYPQYAVEFARLDTFQMWPKNAVIRPIELVKAGFYYVGYADDVKCFFCGGAIRCWEAGADPWHLHARWFSNCGFLKLNRGEEYINGVLSQYSQVNPQHMQRAVSGVSNQHTLPDVLASADGKENDKSSDSSPDELQPEASGKKTNNKNNQRKKKDRKRNNKKSNKDSDSVKQSSNPDDLEEEGEGEDLIHLRKEYERVQSERLCKMCMDKQANIAFLPCGHIVSCPSCAAALRTCPVCRTLIKGSVRVFIP